MEELINKLDQIIEKFNVDKKRTEISQIETESSNPDFWKNPIQASAKMQKLSQIQKDLEEIQQLQFYAETDDIEKLKTGLEKFAIKLYFGNKHDNSDAILAIHAGQGGTEAMDWVSMLYRMYSMYIENKNWQVEIVDESKGEEAGIKSIIIIAKGVNAYGYLKCEKGVHRLVRQSPFNADRLRQTSFALVEVWPVIDDDSEITISADDLQIDTYRSSGKGGQNVNKVETAVRIKHIPTGIIVTSQTQRYQAQNKENALKLLKSKLWELKEQEMAQKKQSLKGSYQKPGWGNQIRSYVLHPYHLVKDLRTDHQTSDTDKVLAGDIEPFIESYLKKFTEM